MFWLLIFFLICQFITWFLFPSCSFPQLCESLFVAANSATLTANINMTYFCWRLLCKGLCLPLSFLTLISYGRKCFQMFSSLRICCKSFKLISWKSKKKVWKTLLPGTQRCWSRVKNAFGAITMSVSLSLIRFPFLGGDDVGRLRSYKKMNLAHNSLPSP